MIIRIFIALLILASRLAAQPANDCCSNAIVLPDGPYPVMAPDVDSTLATANTCGFTDPIDCNSPSHNSIWYTWTAPATGHIALSMCGSNYGAVQPFNFPNLGIYGGTCALTGSALTCVSRSNCGGGEDDPQTTSFNVTGGTTYLFLVQDTATNGATVSRFEIDNFIGTPTVIPGTATPTPTSVNTSTETQTPVSSFTPSLTPVDTPTRTITPTITNTTAPTVTPTCVPDLGFCFNSSQCCSTFCSGNVCLPAAQGFTPTNTPTRTPIPINTATPLVCAEPIIVNDLVMNSFFPSPAPGSTFTVPFTKDVPAGHAILLSTSFGPDCSPNPTCGGSIVTIAPPDPAFVDTSGNQYFWIIGHAATAYTGGYTPGNPLFVATGINSISAGDTITMQNSNAGLDAVNITVQAWDISGLCSQPDCVFPTCQCIDSTQTFPFPRTPALLPTPPLATQFAACTTVPGSMEWLSIATSPPSGGSVPGSITISDSYMTVSSVINDGINTVNAEHVYPTGPQCSTIDLTFGDTSGWHYLFIPLVPNCPCITPSPATPTVTMTPTRAHRCATFTPTPQATRGRKNLPYWFE